MRSLLRIRFAGGLCAVRPALLACLLVAMLCGESAAVFWRADWPSGDPLWRTSFDGLMTNVAKVDNSLTSDFGSGILLHEKWVLTVEHVVDDDGALLADPLDLTVLLPNYGGTFSVDEVHAHPSSDIALLKLTTEPTGWIDVPINDINDEVGKTLEVGGFGYYGPAGTQQGLGSYHRAQNVVDGISGDHVQYDFDAPGSGAILREGISDNGDSGGPVLLETVGDQWVLGALSRLGSGGSPVDYGKTSSAIKMTSFVIWIQSLVPDVLLRSTLETAAVGDLNFDTDVNLADIELLLAAEGMGVPEVVDNYDLFDDGIVDATPYSATSDLDALVQGILGTDYGDSNLDGDVDHDDLLAWQTAYNSGSAAWNTGDANVDGRIDGLDLLLIQQNYTGSGLAVTTVPEPSGVVLLGCFVATVCRRRVLRSTSCGS